MQLMRLALASGVAACASSPAGSSRHHLQLTVLPLQARQVVSGQRIIVKVAVRQHQPAVTIYMHQAVVVRVVAAAVAIASVQQVHELAQVVILVIRHHLRNQVMRVKLLLLLHHLREVAVLLVCSDACGAAAPALCSSTCKGTATRNCCHC
jgi:hypothetical protein